MAKRATNNSDRTKKEAEYPLWKYLELEGIRLNRYTYAHVMSIYHGILKTKNEWKNEMKDIVEGEK